MSYYISPEYLSQDLPKSTFNKILQLYENMKGKRASIPTFYDELKKCVDCLFQQESRYYSDEIEMTLKPNLLHDLHKTMGKVKQYLNTTYTDYHAQSTRPLSYGTYETFMEICHECGNFLRDTKMTQLHKETQAEYNNHNKPIQQGTVTPHTHSPPDSQTAEQDQATERAISDTVASLQYQVRALQEQMNVLELTKRLFNSDQQAYTVDKRFFVEQITELNQARKDDKKEIKELKKARNDDKASFDSKIASVQTGVDSLSAISARVATLESLVATLRQKQVKPKSWFRSEQPTLLDSRPDTHPHAHLSALLHEMHDLNMDHSYWDRGEYNIRVYFNRFQL